MRFQHHPDGLIYVDDFVVPLAEFLVDEPSYSLSAGMVGREYAQNKKHLLFDGQNQYPGPMPWPEGDLYLSKKSDYKIAYAARHAPPSPTLNETKSQCLAAVDFAAAKTDAKYLTIVGLQGVVYGIKEKQARAYKAAGYPALAEPLADPDPAFLDYGHVRQYRETLRLTDAAATDQAASDAIVAKADQMVRLSIARERRLTFKQQIRDATTAAQAQAARDVALAELGAL